MKRSGERGWLLSNQSMNIEDQGNQINHGDHRDQGDHGDQGDHIDQGDHRDQGDHGDQGGQGDHREQGDHGDQANLSKAILHLNSDMSCINVAQDRHKCKLKHVLIQYTNRDFMKKPLSMLPLIATTD